MSAKVLYLDYEPQPRQQILHETKARFVMYGGSAGGGKIARIKDGRSLLLSAQSWLPSLLVSSHVDGVRGEPYSFHSRVAARGWHLDGSAQNVCFQQW